MRTRCKLTTRVSDSAIAIYFYLFLDLIVTALAIIINSYQLSNPGTSAARVSWLHNRCFLTAAKLHLSVNSA